MMTLWPTSHAQRHLLHALLPTLAVGEAFWRPLSAGAFTGRCASA